MTKKRNARAEASAPRQPKKPKSAPTPKPKPKQTSKRNEWPFTIIAERTTLDGTTKYQVRWDAIWLTNINELPNGMIGISPGQKYPGIVTKREDHRVHVQWTDEPWYNSVNVPAHAIAAWRLTKKEQKKKTENTQETEAEKKGSPSREGEQEKEEAQAGEQGSKSGQSEVVREGERPSQKDETVEQPHEPQATAKEAQATKNVGQEAHVARSSAGKQKEAIESSEDIEDVIHVAVSEDLIT